jgi:hypothetical protein
MPPSQTGRITLRDTPKTATSSVVFKNDLEYCVISLPDL